MEVFAYCGLIALLFYVFWEDAQSLTLPLWVFPFLAVNWSLLALLHIPWEIWLQNSLINTAFVLISVLLLRQYALWRFGTFINTTFGLGDIFFLFTFALGYAPQIFLMLWIGGSLSALLMARLLQLRLIPYAGYLAFANGLALGVDLLCPTHNILQFRS